MNRLSEAHLKPAYVAFILTLVYLACQLSTLSFVELPSLKTQDLFYQIARFVKGSPQVLNQIVLIAVDDESIQKLHQKWPFDRAIFAHLVDQLSGAGAKTIAFDFVFSGKTNPADDFKLGEAIDRARNVVIASFVDGKGNYILPQSEFINGAAGIGVINKILDQDLVVRRANTAYFGENKRLIAMPWEFKIAEVAFNESIDTHKKTIRINYQTKLNDLSSVPIWKVLDGANLNNLVKEKIVLIGTTSQILHDYYDTPLGLMPGVVINVNLLATLHSRTFLTTLPRTIQIILFWVFLYLASFLSYTRTVRGLLILVLASLGFSVLYFILFANYFLGDLFGPLFFGWVAFISISFRRYVSTLIENVQLRGKVLVDPLTGLYNRRILESKIEEELSRSKNVCTLMIDVDNFKKINDVYGHQAGDDVLKNVGFSIKEELRKEDWPVRYGGEEFCIILPRTSKAEAFEVAERIRLNVAARQLSYVNQLTQFTVSIGVCSAAEDDLYSSRALIRAADTALYEAKRTGKNRVSEYSSSLSK